MKRVVLDTNVFVSAILNPSGPPSKLFELERARKIIFLFSPDILDEYRQVLAYPHLSKLHGLSSGQIKRLLLQLVTFSELITPENSLHVIESDPSDNKFLECAVEGGADYIISGDRHLKTLGRYQGIEIVTPAVFLTLLK